MNIGNIGNINNIGKVSLSVIKNNEINICIIHNKVIRHLLIVLLVWVILLIYEDGQTKMPTFTSSFN